MTVDKKQFIPLTGNVKRDIHKLLNHYGVKLVPLCAVINRRKVRDIQIVKKDDKE